MHSARNSIDQALLSMRLDVTRNLSQEILTSFSTITRDIHRDNNPNRITTTQPGRVSNGRNTSQIATNGNLINVPVKIKTKHTQIYDT